MVIKADMKQALLGANDEVYMTPAKTKALLQKVMGEGLGAFVPIGTVLEYAGAAAPTGFLLCDGAAVSRTTYANLFALIGTAFGAGNGTTTFNLPNKKGRAGIGVNSADATCNTIGETSGADSYALAAHTHTGPSHTHTGPSHTHPLSSAGWAQINHHDGSFYFVEVNGSYNATGRGASTGANDTSAQTQGVPLAGATDASGTGATGSSGTGATGSSGSATIPTRTPSIAMNYIIKY